MLPGTFQKASLEEMAMLYFTQFLKKSNAWSELSTFTSHIFITLMQKLNEQILINTAGKVIVFEMHKN